MAGPQFVKFFVPVISALKQLGNSGTPAEVRQIIAEQLKLSDDALNNQLNSGGSRFENQVAWARFYLAKGGYLDASKRGVWSLTEKGVKTTFSDKEALKIFKTVHQEFKKSSVPVLESTEVEEQRPPTAATFLADYRTELLGLIKKLPPAGFEKLCQRLLRESGFQQVEVTGRTGDGGIDGKGILQIGSLLSFRVAFQAKRYKNTVGAPQIRDFRGAIAGRVDKGIFIITSTFTAEAQREAQREGVEPIELIDSDDLVSLFEKLELGLTPKTVYEVDKSFFEEFA